MPQLPKVAIVMPYYNEPDLLKRSVDGVLKQSFYNWKLFIVDDGSTIANKADHHVIQNRQIKIINKPNSGVADARNRAIDHIQAEGGYTHIAYCDSDDVWNETHLEESLKVLEVSKADLTYSIPDLRFIDGTQAFPYNIPTFKYDTWPGLEELKKGNFIYVSSVVHSMNCTSVGGFDKELNSIEDWDMWLRIAEAGYKIEKGYLKTPTFIYLCKQNGNGSKRTEDIYNKFKAKHNID